MLVRWTALMTVVLAALATPSATPPATAQTASNPVPLPPEFRGEIQYRGTYKGTMVRTARASARNRGGGLLGAVLGGSGPEQPIGGQYDVLVRFNGAAINGQVRASGGMSSDTFTGNRSGLTCSMIFSDGSRGTAFCNRVAFRMDNSSDNGRIRASWHIEGRADRVTDAAYMERISARPGPGPVAAGGRRWSADDITQSLWATHRPAIEARFTRRGYAIGGGDGMFPSARVTTHVVHWAFYICQDKTPVEVAARACFIAGLGSSGFIRNTIVNGRMGDASRDFADCRALAPLPECIAFADYISKIVYPAAAPSPAEIAEMKQRLAGALATLDANLAVVLPAVAARSDWRQIPPAKQACLKDTSYSTRYSQTTSVDNVETGRPATRAVEEDHPQLTNVCRAPVTFRPWCGSGAAGAATTLRAGGVYSHNGCRFIEP